MICLPMFCSHVHAAEQGVQQAEGVSALPNTHLSNTGIKFLCGLTHSSIRVVVLLRGEGGGVRFSG